MDTSKIITPVIEKTSAGDSNRLKLNESVKYSENLNPNVCNPGLKFSNSTSMIKSGKSAKKYASINPNQVAMPPLKKNIRGRKFVIAKKKSRNQELNSSTSAVACDKCKKAIGQSKCLCLAYKSLLASHEEFFRNYGDSEVDYDEKINEYEDVVEIVDREMEGNDKTIDDLKQAEMNLKRSRDRLLEEARECVPEPGFGRVMHLVKAFERLTLLKLGDSVEKETGEEVEDDKTGIKWALPGLQLPPKLSERQVSSSSLCPSDFFVTSESLGLDLHRYCSLDSSQGSFNFSSRTPAGGPKNRRSSTESSGTFASRNLRRKQQKATSQKPFMLRTEQRGKCKEEEFMKKLQQMKEEEEKLRVPTAQFVPLTTDEPECLVKPPVKVNTRPVDVVLHSDIRAVERAEFDHQVAEKLSRIEQYRMERERQQKLEEEEEIRRLRKELVPKAQPMPYFDRPFIPRRSMKHPTIPKEPKFHLPQHKKIKCYTSLDDKICAHRVGPTY
ncbi:hypothetical protein ACJIZ3_014719 [Penstemon smallii]|uniref:TPX2 C-terminal domain-containing protein n=1 Tax=Penstemon smallii TaxID=265156 RepID=A0ABD3RNU0_9LAMI